MKVTQKAIDIARSRLPIRPETGLPTEVIRVYSYEVGIGSEYDESAACLGIAFRWDQARHEWKCVSPIDKPNIGRSLKSETTINTEHCFSESKPALNVVDLKPTIKDSGAHVIERLEQALAMAKEGYVSNVAVLIVQENGDVMDCWANSSSPFTMVGGLESLKFEFMSTCIESR